MNFFEPNTDSVSADNGNSRSVGRVNYLQAKPQSLGEKSQILRQTLAGKYDLRFLNLFVTKGIHSGACYKNVRAVSKLGSNSKIM